MEHADTMQNFAMLLHSSGVKLNAILPNVPC